MSKFVKLHQEKDEVYVNLDYVAKIQKKDENSTYVHFSSSSGLNSPVIVTELPDEIVKL